MSEIDVEGSGTPDDPWILLTPPGKSEFEAYRDPAAEPPALTRPARQRRRRRRNRATTYEKPPTVQIYT